jgi:hypothetical protein
MNVKTIIKEYLSARGYDGLVSDDCECGCLAEDLAPCGDIDESCKPAYNHGTKEDFLMKEEKP